MKVVILAGGLGTRMAEYTESIPKPMVTIGTHPILWHIMQSYAYFGYKDFYLALGYKAEMVKDFFLNYRTLNSDFTIDLSSGKLTPHQAENPDWRVTLVNTGLNSMTGGRIKRMQSFIANETFMLTYGDGVADINLAKLVQFHKAHGKMVTVSAVHPNARFGELDINGEQVTSFKEKPQIKTGWINGGYFVIEPDIFDLIDNDQTIFEQEPLEKVAKMGQLMAYRHDGFWQCMDTKRDRDTLEILWNSENPPWKQS